ncbi:MULTISPECIES: AAA family ATPase [unclassified Streptomyces]|uniref:ATP-binding protein n=1 Tax=unclassified Streptomyces TaxID=2593676 RepID=UPI00081DFA58|nr:MULTISPECIES: AAA family ATPase [unclassified Streptomyces]MYR26255.1 AAA family ATPase [Streptomyces sp. SID4945]SCE04130.1 AAA ATPase domain-containing protein [Streptomyces sp. TverLS-915]SCE98916.1 AAA ATPase domain-containing protein [Streptomyces sp. LcepLS]
MTANARQGAHDHGESPYGEAPGNGAGASYSGEALWERERELRLVDEAIERLCEDREGGGSLLVFSGVAGIGKTRLLQEVRRRATARAAVWSARGGQTVSSVPFNLVRQLLQHSLLAMTPEEARAYLGERHDVVGPALGIADPGGRTADPRGVIDSLVSVVTRLVQADWPVVILVDDVHWADPETLDWLAAFAKTLDSTKVLLVVALREDGATGRTAQYLKSLVDQARPAGNRLQPLGPVAAAELTRATFGSLAEDGFCREVWAVTGGNPYDTVELLSKARENGVRAVESEAGQLRGLNAASRGTGLVERIEALGAGALNLARSAAVLGTDITLPLAARLSDMPLDEAATHLARLRAARVLTGSEDDLQFVHPLIATAVHESMRPFHRTALHGRAADLVMESGRGPAAASRHLLQLVPDDDPHVVAQLRAAAREHLAVGAPEAARLCLERALLEPPAPGVHAQVSYELGCATLLTDLGSTVRHLRAALELPDGLRGKDRIDAVCRLSQALVHLDRLREAVDAVDREAALLDEGPDRMRLQGVHFMWEGIFARENDAEGRSARLAALADPLTGRDTSERALLILRAFDVMARGENAEQAVELCDRALVNGQLPPGLGWTDTEWSFELLVMLGGAYIFSDRLDRASSLFTEALDVYRRQGWSGNHLGVAQAFVGYVKRRRGQLRDARGMLKEALRLADRVGSRMPLHWDIVCMLADTLLAQGEVREAEELMEQYAFRPPYPDVIVLPDAAAVRGRLLLALGRRKEAIDELEAGLVSLTARGWHNTVLAPVHGELALAVAPDDPGRAAELVATARRAAERFGTDTAIGESLRQAAAVSEGQYAASLLARAVTYLEHSPCSYEHARARVEYGLVTRSRKELDRGLTLARSCGATGLARLAATTLEEGRGLY